VVLHDGDVRLPFQTSGTRASGITAAFGGTFGKINAFGNAIRRALLSTSVDIEARDETLPLCIDSSLTLRAHLSCSGQPQTATHSTCRPAHKHPTPRTPKSALQSPCGQLQAENVTKYL